MNMNSKKVSFSIGTKEYDGNSVFVEIFSKFVMSYFDGKLTTIDDIFNISNVEMYIDYFIYELKIIEEGLEGVIHEDIIKTIENDMLQELPSIIRTIDFCSSCKKKILFERNSCKRCVNVAYCSSKCVNDDHDLHKPDCEWNHPKLNLSTQKKSKKGVGIIRGGSRILSHKLFIEHLPFLKNLLHLTISAKEKLNNQEDTIKITENFNMIKVGI
jgi:hypothetical protein